MTERPILFSGPMVRAILAGLKTQTRRIVKDERMPTVFRTGEPESVPSWYFDQCPHGKPGDRLWVRETWAPSVKAPKCQIAFQADGRCYGFGGDGAGGYLRIFHGWLVDSTTRGDQPGDTFGRGMYRRWKPSIHMPRWASRISLEITDVRVERLQEIDEEDAMAEGVQVDDLGDAVFEDENDDLNFGTAKAAFSGLWDSINGKRAPWRSNPWVWVITFRRVEE